MKKLLSVLITTVLLLSLPSVTAYADDKQVSEGTASATMTYRVQSNYCILIPETIDADFGQYTFQAEYLNIADGEKVFVTVTNTDDNGRILFTHENGVNTLKKNIISYGSVNLPNNCVGCFYGDDVTSKISFGVSDENFDYDYVKAGMYSAIVEFNVYLGN